MATLVDSKDVTKLLPCTEAVVVTPDSTGFCSALLAGEASMHIAPVLGST